MPHLYGLGYLTQFYLSRQINQAFIREKDVPPSRVNFDTLVAQARIVSGTRDYMKGLRLQKYYTRKENIVICLTFKQVF